jgi:nitrate reductase (cytochrome), electron transfer subunit
MVRALCLALIVAFASAPLVSAAPLVDAMRGPVPLADEPRPPPLGNQENKDIRRNRAFAMQPPTIPHRIDGYQVDRSANRCVGCHARTRIEESKAIPIPATHYLDRDGTMRGDISPRRYFCTQCHVPQDEVKPLVDNTFQEFQAIAPAKGGAAAPKK